MGSSHFTDIPCHLGRGRCQNVGLLIFAIFWFCCCRGYPCFTNLCLVKLGILGLLSMICCLLRGSYQTIWGPPLPNVYTIFSMMTIYSDTLNRSDITPIFDPVTDLNLTLYLIARGFRRGICNGCSMPTEDAYSSWHLVLFHLWISQFFCIEINLSWTCLVMNFCTVLCVRLLVYVA